MKKEKIEEQPGGWHGISGETHKKSTGGQQA